jgi:hypothetical protein
MIDAVRMSCPSSGETGRACNLFESSVHDGLGGPEPKTSARPHFRGGWLVGLMIALFGVRPPPRRRRTTR